MANEMVTPEEKEGKQMPDATPGLRSLEPLIPIAVVNGEKAAFDDSIDRNFVSQSCGVAEVPKATQASARSARGFVR